MQSSSSCSITVSESVRRFPGRMMLACLHDLPGYTGKCELGEQHAPATHIELFAFFAQHRQPTGAAYFGY